MSLQKSGSRFFEERRELSQEDAHVCGTTPQAAGDAGMLDDAALHAVAGGNTNVLDETWATCAYRRQTFKYVDYIRHTLTSACWRNPSPAMPFPLPHQLPLDRP